MNRTPHSLILGLAMTGLLAGTAARAQASSSTSTGSVLQAGLPLADTATADTHSCKGKNTCKGKGGCSSGDNGCKGKNTCKGKGGCKTS
jgi:hypothetical protein